MRSSFSWLPLALAHAVIVLVVALMLSAFLPGNVLVGRGDDEFLYPFINFPMFANSRRVDQVEATRVTFELTTRSGESIDTSFHWHERYGLQGIVFHRRFVRPLVRHPQPTLRDLATWVSRGRPEDPVVFARVTLQAVRLEDGELVEHEPRIHTARLKSVRS